MRVTHCPRPAENPSTRDVDDSQRTNFSISTLPHTQEDADKQQDTSVQQYHNDVATQPSDSSWRASLGNDVPSRDPSINTIDSAEHMCSVGESASTAASAIDVRGTSITAPATDSRGINLNANPNPNPNPNPSPNPNPNPNPNSCANLLHPDLNPLFSTNSPNASASESAQNSGGNNVPSALAFSAKEELISCATRALQATPLSKGRPPRTSPFIEPSECPVGGCKRKRRHHDRPPNAPRKVHAKTKKYPITSSSVPGGPLGKNAVPAPVPCSGAHVKIEDMPTLKSAAGGITKSAPVDCSREQKEKQNAQNALPMITDKAEHVAPLSNDGAQPPTFDGTHNSAPGESTAPYALALPGRAAAIKAENSLTSGNGILENNEGAPAQRKRQRTKKQDVPLTTIPVIANGPGNASLLNKEGAQPVTSRSDAGGNTESAPVARRRQRTKKQDTVPMVTDKPEHGAPWSNDGAQPSTRDGTNTSAPGASAALCALAQRGRTAMVKVESLPMTGNATVENYEGAPAQRRRQRKKKPDALPTTVPMITNGPDNVLPVNNYDAQSATHVSAAIKIENALMLEDTAVGSNSNAPARRRPRKKKLDAGATNTAECDTAGDALEATSERMADQNDVGGRRREDAVGALQKKDAAGELSHAPGSLSHDDPQTSNESTPRSVAQQSEIALAEILAKALAGTAAAPLARTPTPRKATTPTPSAETLNSVDAQPPPTVVCPQGCVRKRVHKMTGPERPSRVGKFAKRKKVEERRPSVTPQPAPSTSNARAPSETPARSPVPTLASACAPPSPGASTAVPSVSEHGVPGVPGASPATAGTPTPGRTSTPAPTARVPACAPHVGGAQMVSQSVPGYGLHGGSLHTTDTVAGGCVRKRRAVDTTNRPRQVRKKKKTTNELGEAPIGARVFKNGRSTCPTPSSGTANTLGPAVPVRRDPPQRLASWTPQDSFGRDENQDAKVCAQAAGTTPVQPAAGCGNTVSTPVSHLPVSLAGKEDVVATGESPQEDVPLVTGCVQKRRVIVRPNAPRRRGHPSTKVSGEIPHVSETHQDSAVTQDPHDALCLQSSPASAPTLQATPARRAASGRAARASSRPAAVAKTPAASTAPSRSTSKTDNAHNAGASSPRPQPGNSTRKSRRKGDDSVAQASVAPHRDRIPTVPLVHAPAAMPSGITPATMPCSAHEHISAVAHTLLARNGNCMKSALSATNVREASAALRPILTGDLRPPRTGALIIGALSMLEQNTTLLTEVVHTACDILLGAAEMVQAEAVKTASMGSVNAPDSSTAAPPSSAENPDGGSSSAPSHVPSLVPTASSDIDGANTDLLFPDSYNVVCNVTNCGRTAANRVSARDGLGPAGPRCSFHIGTRFCNVLGCGGTVAGIVEEHDRFAEAGGRCAKHGGTWRAVRAQNAQSFSKTTYRNDTCDWLKAQNTHVLHNHSIPANLGHE